MPLEEKAVLPPGLSVFSNSRTETPLAAATKAAIMPHPPAPTMIELLASASEYAMRLSCLTEYRARWFNKLTTNGATGSPRTGKIRSS